MKKVLYWSLAVIITLGALIYQRRTGPTKPKRVKVMIENTEYKFQLIRSHGGDDDARVEISVPDEHVSGIIRYRLFPTNKEWTEQALQREGDKLVGVLPHLPPAGKYEYNVILSKNGKQYPLVEDEMVVIRFKGHVPDFILYPHIFFMFFAMFLGNVAGIMALFKYKGYRFYTSVTVVALFVGGMILGPAVQWYAFGEAWAGIPFAWDLTDNKTLLAFIFWLLAYWMNRKKEQPAYTIAAMVVMLLVYSIPHSMYGSQLDPETGKIIQGWIPLIGF